MTNHPLIDFLTNKMSMTDLYQPAVIKELLLHEGTCKKSELASSLSAYDQAVQDYYERVVMRWPRQTLQKHGVISYSRKGSLFSLCHYPADQAVRSKAIEICTAKIKDWLERKNGKTGSRQASASLRYSVLKGAGGKCEPCGIPANIRPIDIDHVVPPIQSQ
jgi:hypothetical protein